MYGYTLNENGQVVHYGSTPDVVDPATYQTDVYSAKAEDGHPRAGRPAASPSTSRWRRWRRTARASRSATAPATTRARRRATRASSPASRCRSRPTSTRPTSPTSRRRSSNLTLMNQTQIDAARDRYRARPSRCWPSTRWSATSSTRSRTPGELNNTVFIFTADNGFFHGEHRVRNGKVRLYEESIRVPLMIRGPGVPEGQASARSSTPTSTWRRPSSTSPTPRRTARLDGRQPGAAGRGQAASHPGRGHPARDLLQPDARTTPRRRPTATRRCAPTATSTPSTGPASRSSTTSRTRPVRAAEPARRPGLRAPCKVEAGRRCSTGCETAPARSAGRSRR